ncbi:hypothetical protein Acy02nite_47110 [Actinoplanes cyaneus]|uniref:Uncharacterized protein n=1 Tax=Actinoplanes cyaneus TaxID=52696 RepID=A0A919M237_9ACTN|nr:hypothetical protein [Actinoplanes cyaneus]MCW2138834.1 hypothetical protein [Actinoplanes cyaneus]GID66830.1 hypothetical protein Acy02nite_47110 [Actinoplanes cyaneus]
MAFDASRYVVGDEWAYRLRDTAPSERVRIKAVTPKKTTASIEVEFPDDSYRVQIVPSSRLRVRWADVEAYDAQQASWQRIADFDLDSVERSAVLTVYSVLIPEEVAELDWRPVEDATIIKDVGALDDILQAPAEEILSKVPWFTTDDGTVASPAGTLLIAEIACRAHSHTILQYVIEEEAKVRHKCKHGGPHPFRKGEHSSPEWEYEWYRKYVRPEHELLRQWCGHRAVAAHERLTAAEAENHRLDLLVVQLIKALDLAGDTTRAEQFAEEHERDRITPYLARPVIDRPLHWSEIPVREVKVYRRRHW